MDSIEALIYGFHGCAAKSATTQKNQRSLKASVAEVTCWLDEICLVDEKNTDEGNTDESNTLEVPVVRATRSSHYAGFRLVHE